MRDIFCKQRGGGGRGGGTNNKVWLKVPGLENYWSICLQISIIIVSNECNCFTDSIDRNVEEKV